MADIDRMTVDATIFSSDGITPVAVKTGANPQLYVYDPDVLGALNTPSAASSPDLWQFYVGAQKGYSATTTFVTISGQAETDFMLVRNPSASTIRMFWHDLDYTYNKGSGISVLKVYRAPTVTAVGTLLNVEKRYIGGAIANQTLAYQTPTISARGTLIRVVGNSATATFTSEEHLGFILPANTDILITIQPAANNTDHSIYIDWAEAT